MTPSIESDLFIRISKNKVHLFDILYRYNTIDSFLYFKQNICYLLTKISNGINMYFKVDKYILMYDKNTTRIVPDNGTHMYR